MSRGKMGSKHAERMDMRGQRLSVFPQSEHRLRLGLGEMRLQRQAVGARKIAAPDEKCITAMERNSRCDGRSDPIAIEGPIAVDLFDRVRSGLVGREVECAHVI